MSAIRRRSRERGVMVPLVIGLVVVFALVAYFLTGLLDSEPKPVQQVVNVQVFRPPPPPPPEIEEEPPPPEIEEEELEVPEPEPLPDLPDMPDMPPPESLGLDAEGVAGSDAFGLQANRGGRGLIGSAGAYRWYAQKAKDRISEQLSLHEDLRSAAYRVRVLIWVTPSGGIARVRLHSSTGDLQLDEKLEAAISSMDRLGEPPPPGLPQPIAVRVVGHA